MSDIPSNPSDVSNLVRQRVILPPAIDSIFGSYVMTPNSFKGNSESRSTSIDYDNDNNLYFAFFETTKE